MVSYDIKPHTVVSLKPEMVALSICVMPIHERFRLQQECMHNSTCLCRTELVTLNVLPSPLKSHAAGGVVDGDLVNIAESRAIRVGHGIYVKEETFTCYYYHNIA